MEHFTNRTELVLWLDEHAPTRAIQRAIWDGSVELLGGFYKIPPSKYPGWIFRLKSKRSTEYLVAIICDTDRRCHRCIEIESVPWREWSGKLDRKSIYEGDNPTLYMELKNE